MVVIERLRNSGKTTMLLHYMVIQPNSLYVARTEECAKHAFEKAQDLELNIAWNRFMSIARVEKRPIDHCLLLVDDIDYILKRHPVMGLSIVSKAHVGTISRSE